MTIGRLRRNIARILVSTADTEAGLYDSTAVWRDRAIAGTLHGGTVVLTGGPETGPDSDRQPMPGGARVVGGRSHAPKTFYDRPEIPSSYKQN